MKSAIGLNADKTDEQNRERKLVMFAAAVTIQSVMNKVFFLVLSGGNGWKPAN